MCSAAVTAAAAAATTTHHASLLLRWLARTLRRLVTEITAEVTAHQRTPQTRDHVLLGKIELGMSVFTTRTIRTKSFKVVLTDLSLYVLVATPWTMFTKATLEPLTFDLESIWIDVLIETVVIVAFTMLGEEEATGHLGEIIAMQKFTSVSFFTETSEIMFAYNSFLETVVAQ